MVAWLDKVVCIVVAFMACPSHGPTVMNGCMTVLCAVCLGHLDKVSHSGLEFWADWWGARREAGRPDSNWVVISTLRMSRSLSASHL